MRAAQIHDLAAIGIVACREDLTANLWSILFDHIAGTGNPRTLIDSLGSTRPTCFYRVVITAQ